jgi:Xaa-Pro dipeptidase
MECDAVLLVLPVHVAWFTSGLISRGLIAESERPGVFTNGRQRWLVCSNIDSQRLFDEELDQLGFQLKEWAWHEGRASLLSNIVSGRKVAADRPLPSMPLINERLRPLMRVLTAFERETLERLGKALAHAVEATARGLKPGDTEETAAGRIGHHLLHHGVEPAAISVTADDRGRKYRRAGFTKTPARKSCLLQATATAEGLFATASRTVAFGSVTDTLRAEYDHALKVSAVQRAFCRPGESVGTTVAAAGKVLAGTEYEFESRLSPPAYGSGRFLADELRRGGTDEPFVENQPIVWQARIGSAAVVDTLLVTADGSKTVTPREDWPYKRIRISEQVFEVPDVFVAEAG